MRAAPVVESALDASNAAYRFVVPAGEAWVRELSAGDVLRIVDLRGRQSVDALFYNAHDYSERYSAQDTIRKQRNIYLRAGSRLISSKGNALATIVADTWGAHDTLSGACATESNMVLYALDKRHLHACRQNFLKAAIEWGHGLSKRDISANISFFRSLPVTPDSNIATAAEVNSAPGSYVEMRAEMDLLALISNCPQLGNDQSPTPVEILIWDAECAGEP